MRLLVEVLPEDIKMGEPTAEGCPIALAVRRITGTSCVYVDEDEVWIRTEEGEWEFPLPEIISLMISGFDSEMIMYPFGFTVEANETP